MKAYISILRPYSKNLLNKKIDKKFLYINLFFFSDRFIVLYNPNKEKIITLISKAHKAEYTLFINSRNHFKSIYMYNEIKPINFYKTFNTKTHIIYNIIFGIL